MVNTISLTNQDVIKQKPITLFSPKNPTPTETIFLSNIDQTVTFPVETAYFFEVPPNKPSSSTLGIVELEKKALEDVLLVPYYFMAGRLHFNTEDKRLELLCNNAGVLFVSATTPEIALKDLGDLSSPNPAFLQLVHRILPKSLDETPLFTVQVTRFKCGGFSLGFATNHAITDGNAAKEMFQNLASIFRGEGIKYKVLNNDRTCFKARTPPQIKYPHKEYITQEQIWSLPTHFTSQNKISSSKIGLYYIHQLQPEDLLPNGNVQSGL